MFKNYVLTAWRHILKNKLYSTINIFGLVIGMSVFFFGSMLANYEQSHDTFYKNSERIYTVGAIFAPDANIGISLSDSVQSALAPIIKSEMLNVESVARTIGKEYLVSVEDNDYYEKIRFADAEFLDIFDFTYLEGDATAIDIPDGVLLTRSMAKKYFGNGPALGKSIILDHDKILQVTAVIGDLPQNTHFNSSLMNDSPFGLLAHLSLLNTEENNAEDGNWYNLSMGDFTYMLVPRGESKESLQTQLDGLFESHFPQDDNPIVSGFKVSTLIEANTFLWSAIGLPVMETIQLLGFFVLLVAIVNYTNLATAQSLGRTKEVGLRKTMGANKSQLLIQFLVESIIVAFLSMIIALAVLETAVPIFNGALDKVLIINYTTMLPWLLFATVVIGIMAGAYPAFLITQTDPISALQGVTTKGTSGNTFRSIMLGVQFSISIFILAIVMVVYFQNSKLEKSGDIFPRSEIVTLQRLHIPEIQNRLDTLRNELIALDGVSDVAFSSQVPFDQSNSMLEIGTVEGDKTDAIRPNRVLISSTFLDVYDIPVLKGRALSEDISNDVFNKERLSLNVVVNEMVMRGLGFDMNTENPIFYDYSDQQPTKVYTIVGVVPDQNFLGFHNVIKPWVFIIDPSAVSIGSIRVQGKQLQQGLTEIEQVWKRVIPEYPIQSQFLDENFDGVFSVFNTMTKTLAGFAFLAIALSLIGLFGLAAFLVEKRTKEIGIRKVMGANNGQIVRLLIIQLSKPVLWSSIVALPAAYIATNTYLNFFSDRLSQPIGIVAIAGIVAISFACSVISIHAVKISRSNPIRALRYE